MTRMIGYYPEDIISFRTYTCSTKAPRFRRFSRIWGSTPTIVLTFSSLQVSKAEKKKPLTGRAKKRWVFNRRYVRFASSPKRHTTHPFMNLLFV